MTQTIIPAGYRIHITTWENDADNYRTKTMEGVPKEQVPFVVAICTLLKDGCNDKGYYGNMYEPNKNEIERFKEAVDKLIEQYPDRPKHCDSYEGVSDALFYELSLSSWEFYTRVCDKIKIEYVPTAIVIEDVTDQFV